MDPAPPSKEEKQLDSSLEALIQRITELKNAITSLLLKLENEYMTLSWPTVLDNFALISSEITSLTKLLKNEKTSVFRNYALLPLALSPDRDTHLEQLTEGRVLAFQHDVVPHYLRTKLEPDAEERLMVYQTRAGNLSNDNLQKQITTMNKIVGHVLNSINTNSTERDTESSKKNLQQTTNQNDTTSLIAAVAFGKGLKPSRVPGHSPGPQHPGSMDQRAHMVQQQQQQQQQQGFFPHGYGAHGVGGNMAGQAKAPSTIKTNIKAANNHPYRPM